MDLTTGQWRYRALANGEQRIRYTLMATEYRMDINADDRYVIGSCQFPMWADTWYIVPEHLAKAYTAALATVAELEANIRAWEDRTEHRKRIRK